MSGHALRTIVVATDFSDNARVALTWAEQLARQHGGALLLVHALKPEFDQIGTSMLPQHWHVKQQLEREAEQARSGGITVDCEVGVGAAFEIVIEAARRHEADVIVVGTRGHTNWKRLLLGSTAARLVRNAPCPVFTIHPTDAGPPRPVRTVLVPTDFSEDAALAAEAATRILGVTGADRRLVLLHAYDVPFEATYLPGPLVLRAMTAAAARPKETIEELAAKMRDSGITVDTLTCEGYPPRMILDQAKTVGADLIAMGTHGRSGMDRVFIGSTAERVVASAPCPVLTVRRDLSR
jgi:nucleotide-binding universal stress UspA family protein